MNIALLTAAGSGTRMGQDIPKQFMTIDECPVIIYTMKAFQQCQKIDAIAVICLKGWEVVLKAYANQFGITKLKYIFPGGDSNFHSIRNGLIGLKENGVSMDDIVLIHDGVRPLVSDDIISHNIETCIKFGYAVTGQFCKEVIMEYDDVEKHLKYLSIPREKLVRTQTPHTYKLGFIIAAQDEAIKKGVLDTVASCQLVAQIGIESQHLVLGTEKNGLKLTNVEDIEIFKALKQVSNTVWLK